MESKSSSMRRLKNYSARVFALSSLLAFAALLGTFAAQSQRKLLMKSIYLECALEALLAAACCTAWQVLRLHVVLAVTLAVSVHALTVLREELQMAVDSAGRCAYCCPRPQFS